MALTDKERWNTKYLDKKITQNFNTATKLVKNHARLATGIQALDIACGIGRHSKYLASLGFMVDALDISSVAIAQLQNLDNIHAIEVDFDTYKLEKKKYDLIVCTYFLERKLFPQILSALKVGGIILFETFLEDNNNKKKVSNPTFLLKKKELETYFTKECELICIKEFWDVDYQGHKMMKTSMVAKKK